MKKGNLFFILIIFITLFLSIGYSSINSVSLDIKGKTMAKTQNNVFITSVDIINKNQTELYKTNTAYNTNLDGQIILDNNKDSYITLKVTFFNNSNNDYKFKEITYLNENEIYDNENIIFEYQNQNSIIKSGKSMELEVKFKYDNTNITDTTLNFLLNFKFIIIPDIILGSYIEGYDHTIDENGTKITTTYTSLAANLGPQTSDANYNMDGISNKDTTKPKWRILDYQNEQLIITTSDELMAVEGRYAQNFRGAEALLNLEEECDKISGIYGQGALADTAKFSYTINGKTIKSGARSTRLSDFGYEVVDTKSREYTLRSSTTNSSKLVVWEGSNYGTATSYIEGEKSIFKYIDLSTKTIKSLTSKNEKVIISAPIYNNPSWTDLQREMIYTGTDGLPLKYFVATIHVDIDDKRYGYGVVGWGIIYMQDSATTYGHGVFWSYDTAAGAARTTRPIVYLDKNIDIFYDEETGIYSIAKE